jgi:hypothetical protein
MSSGASQVIVTDAERSPGIPSHAIRAVSTSSTFGPSRLRFFGAFEELGSVGAQACSLGREEGRPSKFPRAP